MKELIKLFPMVLLPFAEKHRYSQKQPIRASVYTRMIDSVKTFLLALTGCLLPNDVFLQMPEEIRFNLIRLTVLYFTVRT